MPDAPWNGNGSDSHDEEQQKGKRQSEYKALQDLALRLLSEHMGGRGQGYSQEVVALWPGQLPLLRGEGIGADPVHAMPLDLPMPEGTRVIGSMEARSGSRGYPSYVILLSNHWHAQDLVYWYDIHLSSNGWNFPRNDKFYREPSGGFTALTNATKHYCRGGEGPYLMLSVIDLPGGLSEIRLELQMDPSVGWCAPESDRGRFRHQQFDEESVIPPLRSPWKARIDVSHAMQSKGSINNAVSISTELDLGELLNHYSSQLQQASWNLEDESATERASWSYWSFSDRYGLPWKGIFLAVPQFVGEPAGERRYYLGIFTYRA